MMTAQQGNERRANERLEFCRAVSVRIDGWAAMQAWAQDLGEGGIRLALPVSATLGQHIDVNLILPNRLQLKLVAEIRYVAPGSKPGECIAGLGWVDPSAEDVQLLGLLLVSLGPPA